MAIFTEQYHLPISTMANSDDSLDKTIAIDDETNLLAFF
jgi:hypothetical protein